MSFIDEMVAPSMTPERSIAMPESARRCSIIARTCEV
jgi:hypothetical protein